MAGSGGMARLADLLAGDLSADVYRLMPGGVDDGADRVTDRAVAAGWRAARLGGVGSKQEALDALGQTLGFPPYYGRNLDALVDCLRDIATPTLLVWEGWAALAHAEPDAWGVIVGILRARAAEGGLAVVLLGDGPLLDVPVL